MSKGTGKPRSGAIVEFWGFQSGVVYMASGMLETDGLPLSN